MAGFSYVTVTPEDLRMALESAGKKGERAAKKALRQETQKIRKLSQRMAPVDKHNLEDAHHLVQVKNGPHSTAFEIRVDGVHRGRDVAGYAMEVHEKTDLNLGPKSREKAAKNPQIKVGDHYLERAYIQRKEKLIKTLFDVVRRTMGHVG